MGASKPLTPNPRNWEQIHCSLQQKIWGFLWQFTRLGSKKGGKEQEGSMMGRGWQVESSRAEGR